MGAQEDEEEAALRTRLAEHVSTFDEFLVWKHEALPDPVEDPYAKGIEEWISFAEAVSVHMTNLATLLTDADTLIRRLRGRTMQLSSPSPSTSSYS